MRRVLLNRARACPVDVLSTRPTAAYSTRRLTARYTGPCLNLRRASDNATRDIYFAGDMVDIQAVLSFAGSASAYVVTMYDQIGSAALTNATAANQPRALNSGAPELMPSGVLGVRYVTGMYLQTGTTSVAAGNNAFAFSGVCTSQKGNTYPRPLSFTGNANSRDYNNTASACLSCLTAADVSMYRNSASMTQVLQPIFGYTHVSLGMVNGTAAYQLSNAATTTATITANALGATGQLGVNSEGPNVAAAGIYDGKFPEQLFFGSKLPESDGYVLARNQMTYYKV